MKIFVIFLLKVKHFETTITCTDDGRPALSYSQNFNISVIDVNEPPIDIRLSSNDISENVIDAIGELLFNLCVFILAEMRVK